MSASTSVAGAEITIRRAGPGDSDTVLAMMREIAAEEGVGDVDVTADRWRELLGRDDVVVFVAERGGSPVGYVSAVVQLHLWLGREIVALDDLYVRPGHRDGGIGRRLITAMAGYAAPGDRLVRWGVECDNVDAQRFYRRLGARLRTKTIATWPPAAYRDHLIDTGAAAAGGKGTSC
jgi:ribosomal protein S18 acetylase RimI-like enzyme